MNMRRKLNNHKNLIYTETGKTNSWGMIYNSYLKKEGLTSLKPWELKTLQQKKLSKEGTRGIENFPIMICEVNYDYFLIQSLLKGDLTHTINLAYEIEGITNDFLDFAEMNDIDSDWIKQNFINKNNIEHPIFNYLNLVAEHKNNIDENMFCVSGLEFTNITKSISFWDEKEFQENTFENKKEKINYLNYDNYVLKFPIDSYDNYVTGLNIIYEDETYSSMVKTFTKNIKDIVKQKSIIKEEGLKIINSDIFDNRKAKLEGMSLVKISGHYLQPYNSTNGGIFQEIKNRLINKGENFEWLENLGAIIEKLLSTIMMFDNINITNPEEVDFIETKIENINQEFNALIQQIANDPEIKSWKIEPTLRQTKNNGDCCELINSLIRQIGFSYTDLALNNIDLQKNFVETFLITANTNWDGSFVNTLENIKNYTILGVSGFQLAGDFLFRTEIEIKTYHDKIAKSIIKSVVGEIPSLENDKITIKPKR